MPCGRSSQAAFKTRPRPPDFDRPEPEGPQGLSPGAGGSSGRCPVVSGLGAGPAGAATGRPWPPGAPDRDTDPSVKGRCPARRASPPGATVARTRQDSVGRVHCPAPMECGEMVLGRPVNAVAGCAARDGGCWAARSAAAEDDIGPAGGQGVLGVGLGRAGCGPRPPGPMPCPHRAWGESHRLADRPQNRGGTGSAFPRRGPDP